MPSRAERLFGRLRHGTAYSVLELLLLTLLAVQCARLVWTLATPLGPVGDWKAPGVFRSTTASSYVPGSFDPFFRLTGAAGPAMVTALDLTLHGVREDRATGRGSAIIGLPDGEQGSFAVGEEILPGVSLSAVEFDSVTISRNGTLEQLFLDQSPSDADAAPVAHQSAAPAELASAAQEIQFQPRLVDGRVTGIIVQPSGSGDAFRAAGFAPGDVIMSIDNQRITSVDQARRLIEGAGGEIRIVVDRAGRPVPMSVRLSQ